MDLVSRNGYAAPTSAPRRFSRDVFFLPTAKEPFFETKTLGGRPFSAYSFQTVRRGVSVQPRSRRPGRTGAARGTHARTSTCTPRIPCQAPASFHLSSREAEKDFVQPRCIRLISGHEMPANKSCSPRVIVVALRSRDALCLRCACACHASLAAQTHACRPACSA